MNMKRAFPSAATQATDPNPREKLDKDADACVRPSRPGFVQLPGNDRGRSTLPSHEPSATRRGTARPNVATEHSNEDNIRHKEVAILKSSTPSKQGICSHRRSFTTRGSSSRAKQKRHSLPSGVTPTPDKLSPNNPNPAGSVSLPTSRPQAEMSASCGHMASFSLAADADSAQQDGSSSQDQSFQLQKGVTNDISHQVTRVQRGRSPSPTLGRRHQPTQSISGSQSAHGVLDAQIAQHPWSANNTNVTSSQNKRASVYDGMTLAQKVEAILGRYCDEARRDTEYWSRIEFARAAVSKRVPTAIQTDPRQAPPKPSGNEISRTSESYPLAPRTKRKAQLTIQAFPAASKFGKPIKKSLAVDTIALDTKSTRDVPNFTHYVSIKDNILSTSAMHMHQWPYFEDDFDYEYAPGLKDAYSIDIEDFPRKLRRLMQAQHVEAFLESAMTELDCTWADVLRVLLDPDPDVGSDLDARAAMLGRNGWYDEDQLQGQKHITLVLSGLPPSRVAANATAAVLCEVFHSLQKFSIWHVARKNYLARPVGKAPKGRTLEERICRICFRELCPSHGEMLDYDSDESDTSYTSEVFHAIVNDIVNPLDVNHRTRIAFPSPPVLPPEKELESRPTVKKDPHSIAYWNDAKYELRVENRQPFHPCSHAGLSCEDAQCSCVQHKVMCEKSCGCSDQCSRRYRGCSCHRTVHGTSGKKKIVCFQDERCLCYQLSRECDPDLCGKCGVSEVVNPLLKHDSAVQAGRCRNCSVQRDQTKQVIIGDSAVHGLGLYACEDLKPHEFLGEYKGEVISRQEAERRGAVYEHQRLSYLFSLNAVQEIDSTYFGNMIRFINHVNEKKANLYPRLVMVNTVHRIALYASKAIKAGDELFFDYGPQFPVEQLGGKKIRQSVPQVRNRKELEEEFYDVEEFRDDHGHMRMRKSTRGPGRPRIEREGPSEKSKPAARGRGRGRGRPRKLAELKAEKLKEKSSKAHDGSERTRNLAHPVTFSSSGPSDDRTEEMDVDAADDADFEPYDGDDIDDEEESSNGESTGDCKQQ